MQTSLQNLLVQDIPDAAVTALMADAAAEATHEIKKVEIDGRIFYSVPAGRDLKTFESELSKPFRLKGKIDVCGAESLLKVIERFKNSPAVVQFSRSQLFVHAILNAAADEQPGWADHTVFWQLKKHRDLKAWEGINGKPLSQLQFMLFLEDRVVDVVGDAGVSQSALQTVVGDLEVTTDAKFQAKRDVHNGNYVLHSDLTNKPTVEVPKEFVIGVPIFEGLDIAYKITVRLRYSVKEGALTFVVNLANLDAVLDQAWEEIVKSITDNLPPDKPFIHVP